MTEKKQGMHYAWKIMIGCCFLQAGALGAIMNSGGIFYVPICEDLGFDRGALALYLTFYFVATTFTYPLVARFLPRWDFRKFLTGCFLVLAATEAAMGLFTELWQWYVAGVVLGVAGALVFVVASTVLIENWFVDKRGTALGIAMCGSGVGGVVFPMLGNFLIETIGWRMSYVAIAVIICVLVLPWTVHVFRLHPSDLGLEPYGVEKAAELDAAAAQAKGISAKQAVATVAFVCVFLYAGIEALFSGYNNHLPGFAESIGYSAAFGAGILSLAQLGYVVATLVMGWVTDKIGVAASTYITLAVTALSLLGFCFFQAELPLVVAAFVFGMNSVIITISVPTLISELFGKRDFAQILAYSRMSGIIGCFGAAAVGACYDFTGSYVGSFLAGVGILAACAVLVAIALSQKKKLHARWE